MGSSGTCTWAKTKNYPCPANQHRAVVNIFPIFSHSLHQKGRWCRRVEIPGTRHPSFICVLSETQLWDKKIVYSKADTTLWSQTEGQRVKWSTGCLVNECRMFLYKGNDTYYHDYMYMREMRKSRSVPTCIFLFWWASWPYWELFSTFSCPLDLSVHE